MAKRFTFRLEPILGLRRRHEDRQRRVVADSVRRLLQSHAAITALRRTVADAVAQTRRDRQDERLDIAAALQAQRWRLSLDRRIARQQEETERIQSELNEERVELARRTKERKALQSLRDRRQAEHRAAAARRERLEMDDIAAQLHIRRTRRDAEAEPHSDES